MANRVIKDRILTSPSIDNLSDAAECLFYRLLMVADDDGRFEGDPQIIANLTYPRRRLTGKAMARRCAELEREGIIAFWEKNGRRYGTYLNFGEYNYLRSITNKGKETRRRSKIPEPPPNLGVSRPTDGQPTANSGQGRPTDGLNTYTDVDTDIDTDTKGGHKNEVEEIIEFWASLLNLQQPRKVTREDRKAVEFRLSEGAPVEEIKSVLTWYNAELGNPKTFWGGNNNDGRPIKYNIRKVMKGKLSDRVTYVYEHFLASAQPPKRAPEPEPYQEPPKADPEAAGLWKEILRQFKGDSKSRDMWLRPAIATGLTETTLTIAVPDDVYAEFIKEKFLVELKELAERDVKITW